MTTNPAAIFEDRSFEIERELAIMRGVADGIRDARAIGFDRAGLVAAAVSKPGGGAWRVTLVYPDRVEQWERERGSAPHILLVERLVVPLANPAPCGQGQGRVMFSDSDKSNDRVWSFEAPYLQAFAVQHALHLLATKESYR